MQLKIKSPEKNLYDGEVYGFKGRALDGDLVCLDHHQDYLTILQKGDLVILDEKLAEKEKVTLPSSYILMIENNAAILFS